MYVQSGAGLGRRLSGDEYEAAGATLVASIEDVYERPGIIVKIQKPQPKGQACFTQDITAIDQARVYLNGWPLLPEYPVEISDCYFQ